MNANKYTKSFFFVLFLVLFPSLSQADEIYFKNGDKLSGRITQQTDEKVTIETDAMGPLPMRKEVIDRMTLKEDTVQMKNDEMFLQRWSRRISLGYTGTAGNVQSAQTSLNLEATRKTDLSEWTFKAQSYYGKSDGRIFTVKHYGLVRADFSFGSEKKWYNFDKLETDSDRFSNIDYRLLPSTGIGYWLSNVDDWRAKTELALGFEYTNFRDETAPSKEVVLLPRVFMEKRVLSKMKLSEDLTLYPSVSEAEHFRSRSETNLLNPINDRLSWKLSLVHDFNGAPVSEAKKNDFRLISAIDYMF